MARTAKKNGKKPTVSKLKWKAWKLFSEYIRRRDADKFGFCRCVTCGKRAHWKEMQAGHFLRGRTKGILFDERGVHAQCCRCNQFDDRADDYWVFMEKVYGRDVIDELRLAKWDGGRWKIGELEAIAETYAAKLAAFSVPPVSG